MIDVLSQRHEQSHCILFKILTNPFINELIKDHASGWLHEIKHRTEDFNSCEPYDAQPNTTVFKFDEDPRSSFFFCAKKTHI